MSTEYYVGKTVGDEEISGNISHLRSYLPVILGVLEYRDRRRFRWARASPAVPPLPWALKSEFAGHETPVVRSPKLD